MRSTLTAFFRTALVILAFSGVASAAPVTWTLTDAVFTDGSTLSGSFDYDAAASQYSNINLIAAESGLFSETNYGGPGSAEFSSGDTFMLWTAGIGGLDLHFAESLGSSTSISLVLNTLSYCSSSCEIADISAGISGAIEGISHRDLVSGSVTAVPVPAAVWLFGSALAGLGWMRRRKTA